MTSTGSEACLGGKQLNQLGGEQSAGWLTGSSSPTSTGWRLPGPEASSLTLLSLPHPVWGHTPQHNPQALLFQGPAGFLFLRLWRQVHPAQVGGAAEGPPLVLTMTSLFREAAETSAKASAQMLGKNTS